MSSFAGVNDLRKLYISSWKEKIVIAAIENNQTMALYVCQDEQNAIGSIYKGIVKAKKANIHAFFVDVGKEKELYLHASDCLEPSKMKVGDEIIVQTSKESSRHKSAQATMYISLVGQYLIYSPFTNFIAVSKKLSESERDIWQHVAHEWKREQEGFIIRTAVLSATKEAVEKELHELRREMNQILEKGKRIKTPTLLFKGSNFIDHIATRYRSSGFTSILTDNTNIYEHFKGKLQQSITFLKNLPIQLEKEIQQAMKKIVWMPDGSYLLMEENESLTVIDVNSGHSSLDPFTINQHAAVEALRQLRLRNISGMIVIDFLRMNEKECKFIQKIVEGAAKQDVHTVSIFGFTRMGLFELTRKKIGQNLKEAIEKDM